MVGILLIVVGIAVALIAVALVLNRREGRNDEDLDQENESERDEESPATVDLAELATSGEMGDVELSTADSADPPTPKEEEGQEQPIPDVDEEAPKSELEKIETPLDETPRERRLIAEIYREDVTGRLVVRSADREYQDGNEIENEAVRRRLAYAASDLADWFQGEFEPGGRTAATPTQQGSSPNRMLEEINDVLQRSLANTPERGIRLVPDSSSGVKVLIGVKSYEIEDVPDKKIKGLIRQAVAEWEAGQ